MKVLERLHLHMTHKHTLVSCGCEYRANLQLVPFGPLHLWSEHDRRSLRRQVLIQNLE